MMNVTMQQPLQYPFFMDRQRLPLSMPWSSAPFRFPIHHPQQQFRPPYPITRPMIFPQQKNSIPRPILASTPYTNTRFQHLKKSTSHPNRRSLHRSFDTTTKSHYYNDPVYRSSRAKSISALEQAPQYTVAPLSKAHSWHAMMNHRRSNLSVAYAQEMHISPKRHRPHSPRKKKRQRLPPPPPPAPPQRRLSSSPKRKPSFRHPRKRSIQMPERGIIRISTLDEMPLPKTPIPKKSHSINNDRLSTKGSISINNDRLSMKGSISNSSTHRTKSKGTNSIKNRKIKNNNEDPGTSTDTQSSSSFRSRSSLQERLNGSLRNDPLISAAMEDLRQFRRSSSQNLSLIASSQNLSGDSLHSNSTFRSSSTSRSHSQSSFTSLERSEIRQLIKTIKTKDTKSSNTPLPLSSSSEQSINATPHTSTPIIRTRKSSVTEELDREFNKLRALDPNQEISYVTPSAICKRKKLIGKSRPLTPPLPTFDELLRQVQLRPVDKSPKLNSPVKEKISTDDIYENPLIPVPVPDPVAVAVPVPESSPILSIKTKIEEIKHEYALPIKKPEDKSLPQISHFQPIRNSSFIKPITNNISEKRASRSLSMFNWFHNNSTNPTLTTFQPNRILNNQNEYGTTTTSVKENIYTSDIDVYVPISTMDKTDDNSLQIHLDNQTIITDDFYSDYETKHTTNSSTVLDDFSHLFARNHKHQNMFYKKNQRCSIM